MIIIYEVFLEGVSQGLFATTGAADAMVAGATAAHAAGPNKSRPLDIKRVERGVTGAQSITVVPGGLPGELQDWLANLEFADIPDNFENGPNPLDPTQPLFSDTEKAQIRVARAVRGMRPDVRADLNALYGVPIPSGS